MTTGNGRAELAKNLLLLILWFSGPLVARLFIPRLLEGEGFMLVWMLAVTPVLALIGGFLLRPQRVWVAAAGYIVVALVIGTITNSAQQAVSGLCWGILLIGVPYALLVLAGKALAVRLHWRGPWPATSTMGSSASR